MSQGLYEKIHELQQVSVLSKHEHLVLGIINAIEDKILRKSDQLPSINKMVDELGYARKTIVKAYEDLKSRGIVESKNFKGYFISSEETRQVLKVALVLYAYHSFQESFYNVFRKNLAENMQLDVFFHHNNLEMFNKILADLSHKYGMCVVAPIQSQEAIKALQDIPPEKLLMVDRYIDIGEKYSYIVQEIENNTYEKLKALKDSILQYKELVLFYDKNLDHPDGIKLGFQKFVKEFGIKARIEKEYIQGKAEPEIVYVTISDSWLWELLKDCRNKGYQPGKDIGVIAHNDDAVKEIVFGGITTISTDFKEMALKAAEFISTKDKTQTIVPTRLIRRASI